MSKTELLVFFLYCTSLAAFAQPVYKLSDSPGAEIKSYAVLPEKGYSIEKIVIDSTLHFLVNDSLRPTQASAWWIK